MIIFGTSSSTINPSKLDGGHCPFCKTENQMWVQGYRKYFHVFWIPFFPLWKKLYVVCSHCKGAFEKQEINSEKLISNFEEFEKNKVKIPWYHFTGIIIFLLLITSISVIPFLN